MRRTISFVAVAFMATSWAVAASAQDAPAAPAPAEAQKPVDEEVIVRGRRTLLELRKDLQVSREHVWEVFNDINGNDDFDIACLDAPRTGTRIPKRTCRPKYANDATAEAGKELLRQMQGCAPGDGGCLEAAMMRGSANAQQQQARIAAMDQRLDDAFQQLAREHPELATAILDYLKKEHEYQETVRAREDD